ncbi:MAG TPA: hypothetical protein VJR89_18125, partial [Polyangiales bacterium]|nr:hypothetical protein [Polyangiales bacterium]
AAGVDSARGAACGAIVASGSGAAGSPLGPAAISGMGSASSNGCTVPGLGRTGDWTALPAVFLLLAARILRSRRRPRV